MIKKTLLFGLVLSLFLLSGCFVYGTGTQTGYISAVEDGIVWNRIYLKPSLESTQEDIYIFKEGKENYRKMMNDKNRVEIHYNLHLITLSHYSNDEVASYTVMGG